MPQPTTGAAGVPAGTPGIPSTYHTLEGFLTGITSTPPYILHIATGDATLDLPLLAGGFPLPPGSVSLAPPGPSPAPDPPSTIPRPIAVPDPYLTPASASGYAHDPPVRLPPAPVLRLAENARRCRHALDIVLKGLEGCERAYREGVAKPAMLWREELESEGKRHGGASHG